MKIDVSEDELALVLEALEHLYAYTRAAKRDDSRYQELADRLKVQAALVATSAQSDAEKETVAAKSSYPWARLSLSFVTLGFWKGLSASTAWR